MVREASSLEELHGAGMEPVRVVWRRCRVRLDEAPASRGDRAECPAEGGAGHTAVAASYVSHKASDSPVDIRLKRWDATVQALGAGKRELIGGSELTPAHRLVIIEDEHTMGTPSLDKLTLLTLVLDHRNIAGREVAPDEMAAALVEHASAERPARSRTKQALKVRPSGRRQLPSRQVHQRRSSRGWRVGACQPPNCRVRQTAEWAPDPSISSNRSKRHASATRPSACLPRASGAAI